MSEHDLTTIKLPNRDQALISIDSYEELYQHSIDAPEIFWREQAKRIQWIRPFTQVKDTLFCRDKPHARWFADGQLNVSANCLDRHLATRAEQSALIWEPEDETQPARCYSYQQLHDEVCQLANALIALGVGKGDVVTLYLPMIPELIIAMLACARIGALHCVVFIDFSPEALASRIEDASSSFIITAQQSRRANVTISPKAQVDQAIGLCHKTDIKHVIVVSEHDQQKRSYSGRDKSYRNLIARAQRHCPPLAMDAEDPLFILYTSGSVDKPKAVVHASGGYLVYVSLTQQYIFDHRPGEVFWCTSDIGWITGHSYGVYGPLSNAATVLLFEGDPNAGPPARVARTIDKHEVSTLYTSPTTIRSLQATGIESTKGCSLKSLKMLATAGETLNPQAWHWFYRQFGKSYCPLLDTWWQTETGGIMLSPPPGSNILKPGSTMRPFFGIQPVLLDNNGNILDGPAKGNLVLKDSWPSQARSIYGDHQSYIDSYFSQFGAYFYTGDSAIRDADNDYWICGRLDDVINSGGQRLGAVEIENALLAHPDIAQVAIVSYPHPIKGEGIYAFIVPMSSGRADNELEREVRRWLAQQIGDIAVPDAILWAADLPRTRSGKTVRRVLRKIASGEYLDMGDTSTITNTALIDQLIAAHQKQH